LGISGATVTLTDCNGNPVTDFNGNPVSPKTTGSTGAYLFTNLKPGQYMVTFTLPTGYKFTLPYQGGDPAKDSNATPTTGQSGKSECVTLVSGENNRTIDAGGYKPASLGDFVWLDQNKNGIQDTGEPGISGATVTLTDCNGNPVTDFNGNPVSPKTTGSTGAYLFTNLKPGQYMVTFTLPTGYKFTLPTRAEIRPRIATPPQPPASPERPNA